MCKMCNEKDCSGGDCCGSMVAKILLIIGGINLGLVGIGMLTNSNLNIINLLLGDILKLEAIVYVLVGVAAIMIIFGCKCKKCKAACSSCAQSATNEQKEEKTEM